MLFRSVATNDIANTQPALIITPSVTNDEIRIELPTENASTTLSVLNMQGANVLNTKGGGNVTIDVSNLPAGIYFVKTAQGAQGKFVKQ